MAARTTTSFLLFLLRWCCYLATYDKVAHKLCLTGSSLDDCIPNYFSITGVWLRNQFDWMPMSLPFAPWWNWFGIALKKKRFNLFSFVNKRRIIQKQLLQNLDTIVIKPNEWMILLYRWIEILLPWIYYLSSTTIYYFNSFLIKKNMQIELLPW